MIGGSQLAVSPSYQISWGSTPWNSAGIWDGLTFRKQFEKAFQVCVLISFPGVLAHRISCPAALDCLI